MPVVFDLRAFRYGKAEPAENMDDLVAHHLKGVPDFDAGESRPQTARDAVIEKRPHAR